MIAAQHLAWILLSTAPVREPPEPMAVEGTERAPGPVTPEAPPEAVAPPVGPDAPGSVPGAIGGRGMSPLPAPPPPVDPSTIERSPWRGVGWFDLRLDAVVPVGGSAPAEGNVVSLGGAVSLGWRPHRIFGLYTSLATYVHDREERDGVDEAGNEVAITGFGRMLAFDLAVLRAFLPVGRRVQPWIDAGGGVGLYREPLNDRQTAAGLVRTGVGFDAWLAPTFTLSVGVHYRMVAFDDSVGHYVVPSLELGIHW